MISRFVRLPLIPLTAVLAVLVFTAPPAAAQDLGIAVGAKAPPAMVVTLDGNSIDLASYYGTKPVVLEFWATWCPLCKALEPALQTARTAQGDKIAFVSVGVPTNQTAQTQQAYVDSKHLTGTFVFDRDGLAMKAFSVPHTSYIVVVGKDGKVIYTGVGKDQNIDSIVQQALK